jgi:hypothetical protein
MRFEKIVSLQDSLGAVAQLPDTQGIIGTEFIGVLR